jgi:hypothetical protein
MELTQWIVEEAVRGVGWTLLKVLTLGGYRSNGERARLAEGAVGLAAVAFASWLALRLV